MTIVIPQSIGLYILFWAHIQTHQKKMLKIKKNSFSSHPSHMNLLSTQSFILFYSFSIKKPPKHHTGHI